MPRYKPSPPPASSSSGFGRSGRRTARLSLSDDEFHELHAALDKTRESSTTVKASKQALQNLLQDHAALLRIAAEQGWQFDNN